MHVVLSQMKETHPQAHTRQLEILYLIDYLCQHQCKSQLPDSLPTPGLQPTDP